MNSESKTKVLMSVGGGKGGVGKSIFAIALGTAYARDGRKVALVDLDLGAANLHTYLGITKATPTLADFILKRVPTLEELLINTSVKNMQLISGAEFVPGMANPAHWMKLKIMRHVRALPADVVIIDLGAGVHFNTLDFFSMSDRGIVITAPEPGAVMNAYSFVKGSLFRKLQGIFKKHPEIGPIIEAKSKKTGDNESFSIDWLTAKIKDTDPAMLPLIEEVEHSYCPALIINRAPEGRKHVLVDNLISLCTDRLNVKLQHLGNLPDIKEISGYLLNIPRFLGTAYGTPYRVAVQVIADMLLNPSEPAASEVVIKSVFNDADIESILKYMDGLDKKTFEGTSLEAMKMRIHFKPLEVVKFLIKRGCSSDSFLAG
ncbi:MAG: P-loop NTPase [Nitrospira sp.]|nr:P-loop NTPase [bacterium]MBL7050004.1 P-loop NTPase [Nitrospira sp.]